MAYQGSGLTRRSLLEMGWWSLVAAGLPAGQTLLALPRGSQSELGRATPDSFTPLIGKTLKFSKPAGERSAFSSTVDLELTAVTRHTRITEIEARTSSARMRQRESFSLLFESRRGDQLGPGLHEFTEGEFAGSPLLLTRVLGTGGKGPFRYEAVFG